MTTGRSQPRVGIFGLTGCAGDQLQILNCEDELLRLAGSINIVDWAMVTSNNDPTCRLDIAFVEGVVATELDLDRLKTIRARTNFLVALGTCAVWGGLPAMRNDIPREILEREFFEEDRPIPDAVEALPAAHFVPFEFLLPGCPIERHEFLATVNSLLFGTVPELPAIPVCLECKIRENACRVIEFEEVCCGAMTRGGCGARCPSHGVSCAGCRGPVEEPHYDANVTMFADRGISAMEISTRMRHFAAPAWMRIGLEGGGEHDG
jgi:coenzyme F420-reducing hydrogenase gamma subunit